MQQIKHILKSWVRVEQRRWEPAATRIQAWYRGCRARAVLAAQGRMPVKRGRIDTLAQMQAAVHIQRVWRGHACRRVYRKELEIVRLKRIVSEQQNEIQEMRKMLGLLMVDYHARQQPAA